MPLIYENKVALSCLSYKAYYGDWRNQKTVNEGA